MFQECMTRQSSNAAQVSRQFLPFSLSALLYSYHATHFLSSINLHDVYLAVASRVNNPIYMRLLSVRNHEYSKIAAPQCPLLTKIYSWP